jgi:hypothetical protein
VGGSWKAHRKALAPSHLESEALGAFALYQTGIVGQQDAAAPRIAGLPTKIDAGHVYPLVERVFSRFWKREPSSRRASTSSRESCEGEVRGSELPSGT